MSKKKNSFNINKKTIIIAIIAVVIIGILAATGVINLKELFGEIIGISTDATPTPDAGQIDINDTTPTEKPDATNTPKPTSKPSATNTPKPTDKPVSGKTYKFRNSNLLNQHYDKHGKDMGFANAKEYEKAASDVINNPAALHKTEKEDGDFCYYIVKTNEFVVLSKDGYIRTYFLPDAGKAYYDRQ